MKGALAGAVAVLEIIAVFIVVIVASSRLQETAIVANFALPEPVGTLLFRFIPLVAVAMAIEFALRRRKPADWGLLAFRPSVEFVRSSAALLFPGGSAPLLLSLSRASEPPLPSDLASLLAVLLIPVLGQEVFVVGYGWRRLRDALPARGAAAVVAMLFLLAHANHASRGVLGWLFLAAIAWQGVVWCAARAAGRPLFPMMVAHVALLLCYQRPMLGLAVVGVAGVVGLAGRADELTHVRNLLSSAQLRSTAL